MFRIQDEIGNLEWIMDDVFTAIVLKPIKHVTHRPPVHIVNVSNHQRFEIRFVSMHSYDSDGVTVFFTKENVFFIFPQTSVCVVHDNISLVSKNGCNEPIETVLMCISNPQFLKTIITLLIHKKRIC